MGGKQSKGKKGDSGAVAGGASQSSTKASVKSIPPSIKTKQSSTASVNSATSHDVDHAPADAYKQNGERRKSADLLGIEVTIRAPSAEQLEWEKQLAIQQQSAAWATTVEQQHGTAKKRSQSKSSAMGSTENIAPAAAKVDPIEEVAEKVESPVAAVPEAAVADAAVAEAAVADAAVAEAAPADAADAEAAAPAAATLDNVVFVLGGPGSGKGTACETLATAFNLAHISLGDYMRKEVASGSPDGAQIEQITKEGALVPLELTLRVLKGALEQNKDKAGFLLDGFPRTREQAAEFEKSIGKGKAALAFVCNDSVMLERLRGRAATSGRADDNEETMAKRITTYNESTVPVLDYFRKAGTLCEVDAALSVDEVRTLAHDALVKVGLQAAS